ncbi:MAG: DUF962 domain-containing protein [Elusimicrobia bacterium]|nr:DUF962 domain-containing protein [Elusimicrobiota bacterium]
MADILALSKRAPFPAWDAAAADYAAYHRTPGNQACHLVGIPLIVLGLVRLTQFEVIAPAPLVAALWPVYLFWDLRLAAAMAALLAACAWLAGTMSMAAGTAVFAAGWVFQLVGHAVYEKKRAAFQNNLLHLLVGPAWILAKALRLKA